MSGLVIGYLYYPGLKSGSKKAISLVIPIAILTALATKFYLQNNSVAGETRSQIQNEIDQYKYNDAAKYNEQLTKFAEAEEKAIAPFNGGFTDARQLAEQLKHVSLPEWEKAEQAVKQMKTYKVSDKAVQKAEFLEKYVALRKQETNLRIKMITENDDTKDAELDQINTEIENMLSELKKLQ